MAVSFFAFMNLLSVADLSFAVPATAATYVFETMLARYFLKERVTGSAGPAPRWWLAAWRCWRCDYPAGCRRGRWRRLINCWR